MPIDTLRFVVGALLLAFGLQWLRKAILRASGYKALHDEDEAFREERERAAAVGTAEMAGVDWYSFSVAFKGVVLEGLEVVFIVITFGTAQGRLGLAAATPLAPSGSWRCGRSKADGLWVQARNRDRRRRSKEAWR